MPCHTRMKKTILQGLLWLCLLKFGMVVSIIEPGYLDFDNLPDTNFSCVGKVIGGYYADLETSCQMFHVCTIGQLDEPMDIRFLCLNGTVFDQETRVCERVDEVDCSKSEKFYHLNLELYGNTAPLIVEEPEPTAAVPKQASSSTTQKSTTTVRTTRATYSPSTTTYAAPKVIDSHQYPVNSGPDIRFNPEEINIRLTPGSPPIIKSPSQSLSYQQQSFSGAEPRITVTTHGSIFKDDRPGSTSSTQKPKSVVSYGLQHTPKHNYQPTNYDYSYQQTDHYDLDYNTDVPSSGYSYQEPLTSLGQYELHTELESSKDYQKTQYVPTTKSPQSYPSSTPYSSSLKPPQIYQYQRTEKPSLQIPQSLIPTLPPLTFSSPAPFSLARHFEQKRSNNEHHQPPRVIVSASASVSDASGKRLNYSLGTIGATHIIGQAPTSYDDYRESDVGLDPFYHDVPKVKNKNSEKYRQKRELKESDDIKQEDTTHWVPPEYVDDNYEPYTYEEPVNTESNQNRSLIDENPITTTEQQETTLEPEYEYYDDDITENTEKIDNNIDLKSTVTSTENSKINEVTTEAMTTVAYQDDHETDNIQPDTMLTTNTNTEASTTVVTQESTLESNTVTEPIKIEEVTTASYSTPTTKKIVFSAQLLEELLMEIFKEELTRRPYISSRRRNDKKLNISPVETTTVQQTQSTSELTISTDDEHFVTSTKSSNIETETTESLLTTQQSTPSYYETTTNPTTFETEGSVSTQQTTENSIPTLQVIENNYQETTANVDYTNIIPNQTPNMNTDSILPTQETTPDDATNEIPIQVSSFDIETTETIISTQETTAFADESTLPYTNSVPMENRMFDIEEADNSDTTEGSTVPHYESTTTSTIETTTELSTTVDSTTQKTYTTLEGSNTDIPSTTESLSTVTESYQTTTEEAVEPTTQPPTTTTYLPSTSSTTRYSYLRTREPVWKRNLRTRPTRTRHRFSSPAISMSQSVLRLQGRKRLTTTTEMMQKDEPKVTLPIGRVTDSALSKSANPTESKNSVLSTTPITKTIFIPRRFSYDTTRSFNCINKELKQFYEDPRDCRLFHYCTEGYTDTQVLDMKFVCDYGTYFDSEKLICTKFRPRRCK